MRTKLAVVVGLGLGLGLGCGSAAKPAAPAPAAPAAAAADGCVAVPWRDAENAGEATYTGTLSVTESELPNGTKEKPFILTLARPVCLPAGDEKQATEVQVYGPDPAVHTQLEAAVGKRVVVTGEAFTAHTAHHHRPLVVDVKRVAAQ